MKTIQTSDHQRYFNQWNHFVAKTAVNIPTEYARHGFRDAQK